VAVTKGVPQRWRRGHDEDQARELSLRAHRTWVVEPYAVGVRLRSRSTYSSSANGERQPVSEYPDLTRIIDRQREYAELLIEVWSMPPCPIEEADTAAD
jgi:hypothetical protein